MVAVLLLMKPASAIFKDAFLCVLIRIADVPEEKGDGLEMIIGQRDADLNVIGRCTCLVWFLIFCRD